MAKSSLDHVTEHSGTYAVAIAWGVVFTIMIVSTLFAGGNLP